MTRAQHPQLSLEGTSGLTNALGAADGSLWSRGQSLGVIKITNVPGNCIFLENFLWVHKLTQPTQVVKMIMNSNVFAVWESRQRIKTCCWCTWEYAVCLQKDKNQGNIYTWKSGCLSIEGMSEGGGYRWRGGRGARQSGKNQVGWKKGRGVKGEGRMEKNGRNRKEQRWGTI